MNIIFLFLLFTTIHRFRSRLQMIYLSFQLPLLFGAEVVILRVLLPLHVSRMLSLFIYPKNLQGSFLTLLSRGLHLLLDLLHSLAFSFITYSVRFIQFKFSGELLFFSLLLGVDSFDLPYTSFCSY